MDTSSQINSVIKYLNMKKIKNAIIIISVSIIAFHTLYFIHVFGVNIPFWDEWEYVPFALEFHDGNDFWTYPHFLQHNEHRAIFPLLIFLANVSLTSWNSVYLMYLGWSFLVLISLLIYLMLKKTDSQLTWLLIPISAFLFSTSQYENLLWGIASVAWFLQSLAIIASIFFLSKIHEYKLAIIPAIFFGVVASFSEFTGLLIWMVGILSLVYFKKIGKLPLIVWISSATMIFILYFKNYDFGTHKGIQLSTLFTPGGIKYLISFISNGIVLDNTLLQVIISLIVVGSIIIGSIFLKFYQKDIRKLIPWIQFGIVGIFFALITELGRYGIADPVSSRYVASSNFIIISALVIGAIIFVTSYRRLTQYRKKIIISVVFSLLILSSMYFLSNSYANGWKFGKNWYDQRYLQFLCIQNPSFDFKCLDLFPDLDLLSARAKILEEQHWGPFTSTSPNPFLNDQYWQYMKNDLSGYGFVDYIYDNLASTGDKITLQLHEPGIIPISGWAILYNKSIGIDSGYVFVDGKVQSQIIYGLLREDVSKVYGNGTTHYSGWKGQLNLYNLSDGCHDLSVRIVKDQHYYVITTLSKICVIK